MNKTITLIILTLILSNTVTAQQPEFQWARNMGGNNSDYLKSMVLDGAGNVYTTGFFTGIADFDPGPGTCNFTSAGQNDIFISKLDTSGNFVWAKQLQGAQSEVGTSVAVDAVGNVYTTGYFQGTVDFDPGAGTYNLTPPKYFSGFISKLDGDGNLVWVKLLEVSFGSGSIVLDASGNIYTTGYFQGTVDFDPGAGTYDLSSAGSADQFVSKWDTDGNFVWAKQFAGKSTCLEPYITMDAFGNVYTTGTFYQTVDFDPGAGTYNLVANGTASDIFISKLDNDGNFIWAKLLSGTGNDYSWAIAVDASGNVYTTGSFFGTTDFDPGSGTYDFTAAGYGDIFISKLDASGNFVWAKQMGSDFVPGILTGYFEGGYGIAVDVSGNVYTTGQFQGTTDFDPGSGTYHLTAKYSNRDYDIFISKLDASGNFIWAGGMGATGEDNSRAIALDALGGSLYIGGNFTSTVDFDPGSGVFYINSTGNSSTAVDIFILKMSGGCMAGGRLMITASQDTICRGTPAVLNVTVASGDIQWQSSVTGNNFTGIQGATEASYISQDTVNSYFRVYTSDANCPDTSDVFKLVVQPSPVADFISSGSGTDITFTDKSKGATVYNWDFGDGSTGTEQSPVHTYTSPGSYRVCLTVFNGSNCSFTTCRDIDAGITTSVTDIFAQDNFILYPNPFSRSITIEQRNMNKPIQGIELYDLLGRKIYSEYPGTPNFISETPNFKLLIEIPALPNGMYFVKVKTKNADYIDRVIKQ